MKGGRRVRSHKQADGDKLPRVPARPCKVQSSWFRGVVLSVGSGTAGVRWS